MKLVSSETNNNKLQFTYMYATSPVFMKFSVSALCPCVARDIRFHYDRMPDTTQIRRLGFDQQVDSHLI